MLKNLKNCRNRVVTVVGACSALVATASVAMATDPAITVDYAAITSGLTGQVTAAVTAALPFAGALLGLAVGYKLYKHFAK